MSEEPRVLIVDDESIARENLAHVLDRQGCATATAASGEEALAEMRKAAFDLVITDLMMPGMDGLTLLDRIKEDSPDTEIIVLTGHPTVETAVKAMQRGAYHYLVKPYRLEEARLLVAGALEKRGLKKEVGELKERLAREEKPALLAGSTPEMQALKRTIAQVGPTDSTVLILGETGTGKELAARSLHLASRRAERRFLAINCGAFNDELLENELFGHEQGAFSGAVRRRQGLFEAARGGTLFLDEVGDMSSSMQVKLLRALQERVIRRVGGSEDIAVDVRIVAATNKDLKREVAVGAFRQDLFYRLNVIVLHLPPLVRRRDDIQVLCRVFLDKFAKTLGKPGLELSPEVLEIFTGYAFPGNVRELENLIERAAVLAEGERIEVRHLPPDLREPSLHVARPCVHAPVTLEQNEKEHVAWVLGFCEGNKTRAAKVLGIDRASLWRKLKRFGLE